MYNVYFLYVCMWIIFCLLELLVGTWNMHFYRKTLKLKENLVGAKHENLVFQLNMTFVINKLKCICGMHGVL